MRLALDDRVRELQVVPVYVSGRIEALRLPALDHGRVVGVGDDRALRVRGVRVPDHAEQGLRLLLAVDDPVGVEDLVPAVLRVGLREHRQLRVGRVAPERIEGRAQVVDLVLGQREPEPLVGLAQRAARDALERPRRDVAEKLLGVVERGQHGLGHAVVQRRGERVALGAPFYLERVGQAALDPQHLGQAAIARDVGRLGRPGRNRSQARHRQEKVAARRLGRRGLAVAQQPLEQRTLVGARRRRRFDEMPVLSAHAAHPGVNLLQ